MPSLLRQVKIGVVYVCVFNIFKVRSKQENQEIGLERREKEVQEIVS